MYVLSTKDLETVIGIEQISVRKWCDTENIKLGKLGFQYSICVQTIIT